MSIIKETELRINSDYPNPLELEDTPYLRGCINLHKMSTENIYDFLHWYFKAIRPSTVYYSKGKIQRKQYVRSGANRSLIDLYRLCKTYVTGEKVTLRNVLENLDRLTKYGVNSDKCFVIQRIVFFGQPFNYQRANSLFTDNYVKNLTIAKGYPKLYMLIDEIQNTK